MSRAPHSNKLHQALLVATAFGMATFLASPAHADDASRVQAEALFSQGEALVKAKKYEEARDAFEKSYRISLGEGALINLAFCHEKVGDLVTAAREYALIAMRTTKADRREFATERTRALALATPSIVLIVPPALPEGTKVSLDDLPLETDWYATPRTVLLPVALGAHHIVTEAPGRMNGRAAFQVRAGTTERVELPRPTLPAAPTTPAKVESGIAIGEASRLAPPPLGTKRSGAAKALMISGGAASVIGLGGTITFGVLFGGADNFSDERTYLAGTALSAGVLVLGIAAMGTGFALPLEHEGTIALVPSPGGLTARYGVTF